MTRRTRHLSAALAAGVTLAALLTQPAAAAPEHHQPLPVVTPTPQSLGRDSADLTVPDEVALVTDSTTDAAAKDLVTTLLRQHGARKVIVVSRGHEPRHALVVRLGSTGAAVPAQAEGYSLSTAHGELVIAGRDGAGQYYGAQTLRQLFVRSGHGWAISGVAVHDWPNMALRGSIEGFYGPPWSTADRLRQIAFLGEVKANTYVYSAKDDAYLRAQWRDAYPADELATLGQLVQSATAHHVDFTYALSPGVSICFSSPEDLAAVKAKLQSVYDLGVRSFSMPFDDISYTKWNCAADQTAFGAPGQAAAGKAQVSLLNAVTADFVKTHDGVRPLQTVPTEYSDLKDSPYKTELRENLDPSVVVQWTGTDVVPPSVTVDEAQQVSTVYGRKVFLWDNYPVNDYGQSAGRLLLAPYAQREAGLSRYLNGIVANPMNQEAASEVAEFGATDFAWNDAGYSPDRSWPQALARLAGGDARSTAALQVFADLEHLAPTFGPTPWQPQAPVLAAKTAAFWQRWNAGDHRVSPLRAYAVQIRDAAKVIRGGRVEAAFVDEAAPWLDAATLWGGAMVDQLDALAAAGRGDTKAAQRLTASADALVVKATAVMTGNTNRWGVRQALVGDGVLDAFITQARTATLG
ncbi:beta-N-acetylglucosaminidase domain-containing protein [Amycolatopsis rhabdoformis]|uniref:Beta-N-acetylglucosaminidase domain-containing protein n=1 Tax=Amycolatopsis rhabdoformis TaxID=1448059 RepID=A0ABZ1ICQ3_9PSEU|nr:beta-N-acetylglucosaminidase domain-containing protein [Amycolatopsis rhabdoformis]WSE31824.1 beta-N-acetylglucosaminidase domain-containing protein [Amycolatopsis rhabdoformis]